MIGIYIISGGDSYVGVDVTPDADPEGILVELVAGGLVYLGYDELVSIKNI